MAISPAISETISFACESQETLAETAELATAASAARCGALITYASIKVKKVVFRYGQGSIWKT